MKLRMLAASLLALLVAGVCAVHARVPTSGQAKETEPAQYTVRVNVGSAAAETISLESYLASLDALDETLKTGDAEALAAARDSLPSAWRVEHRGQTAEVSLAWLGALLNNMQAHPDEREAVLGRAQRRLDHMREEARRWLETTPGGAGSASDKLNAILARPEFSKVREPNWFDRLRARIAQWIIHFLDRFFGRLGGFSMVGGIILWSVIAVALIVVLLWVVRALQRRAAQAGMDIKGTAPEKHSWRRWAQQAMAAAARGDYRAAVHHAYWASIYRLEDLGTWEVDRARTHREYLRMLPAQNEHRGSVETLTRRFESVWYGRQAATADDYRDAAISLEKLGCLLGSIPATGNS